MANLDVAVDYLGEEEEEQESNPDLLALFAEEDNLVGQFDDVLDDERLGEIGMICARGFDEDFQSESDWRSDIEDLHKMIDETQPNKTFPWPGAANVVYPMILNAALQFNARAYSTLINDGRPALAKIIGEDTGIPQMDPETNQPLQNPETGEPQWEVEPGAKRSRADRVSEHMSYQLTEEMVEWEEETDNLLLAVAIDGCAFKKVWFDQDLGRNVSEFVAALDLVVNTNTKNMETCPRASQVMAYFPHEIQEKVNLGLWEDPELALKEGDHKEEEFVEQYTYLDLDGDDYSEPYIVTYHKESSKVVRIVANYDVKGIQVVGDDVAKVTKKEKFVKYACFPSATGKYKAKGFGQLLKPINETVNSLINQLIDAGTLSNTGGGFMSKNLRIKGGVIRVNPGEYHKVDVMGGDLKDAILPLPVREPSMVLFSLLGLMIESGEKLANIQDIMTGGGGENAAVGTIRALIEQGMKVYTSIFKRLYRSMKTEMIMLYKLNAEFLEDQVYSNVMDNPKAIARADYEGESLDIMPAADPNMATDIQKAAKADALQTFIGRPWINGAAIDQETMSAMNISDPERFFIPVSDDPTPEELKIAAELAIKKQEADTKRLQAITKAILDLQTTEEKGGSGLVNIEELLAIIDTSRKEGILDDETNPAGADPG